MRDVLKNWPKFKEEIGQVDWATHYNEYVANCRKRLKRGAKLYKDSWKTQDNLKEALEEALDVTVYCYLETEKQKLKPKSNQYQLLGEVSVVALRMYGVIKDLIKSRK